METGKSSSGWVGAAALGLGLLMAWLEGTSGLDRAEKVPREPARHACGGAEGAVLPWRSAGEGDTACPEVRRYGRLTR